MWRRPFEREDRSLYTDAAKCAQSASDFQTAEQTGSDDALK